MGQFNYRSFSQHIKKNKVDVKNKNNVNSNLQNIHTIGIT